MLLHMMRVVFKHASKYTGNFSLQDIVDTTMLISQLKFITVLQTDTHAHLKCAYGYISNIWESIAFFVITLFVLFAFIWNCF